MPRVPFSNLNSTVAEINRIFGAPPSRWQDQKCGTKTAPGHYFIESGSATNGIPWTLCRIRNEVGGERVILRANSRKELHAKLEAFLEGVRVAKGLAE